APGQAGGRPEGSDLPPGRRQRASGHSVNPARCRSAGLVEPGGATPRSRSARVPIRIQDRPWADDRDVVEVVDVPPAWAWRSVRNWAKSAWRAFWSAVIGAASDWSFCLAAWTSASLVM